MSVSRIELNLKNIPPMPAVDARLIDEPMATEQNLLAITTSLNEHELALQFKTWIIKGDYWSAANN